jgi:Na+-translocating ferredoxin:NAD+ oxidoreductase RnfG subunit
MQKTPKMKAALFILAALAAISAVVLNGTYQSMQQTRETKVAAQLDRQREQMRMDDDDYRKEQDKEQKQLAEQVEAIKKKMHSYAGNESKTATTANP